MDADAPQAREVINRLKRARGQLEGVIAMIEDGRSCADIVPQLAAVSKAVNRAGFRIITVELHECAMDEHSTKGQQDALERMFLSLA